MVSINKGIERTLANMARSAVHEAAEEMAVVASGLLEGHRETGEHEITVSQGKKDSFVNLDGYAPGAVEFGHFEDGEWVEGIHVLQRAADKS